MQPLTVDQRRQYDEEGFVVLKGVLPDSNRLAVQAVFEKVVDDLAAEWRDAGFLTDTGDALPFEKRFARLREQVPPRIASSWRSILVSRPVYDLWQLPQLLGPIRSIVGDEVYAHGVWNGRPREPGTAIQKVYWHQDAHYYKQWDAADGPLVSVWMPLVPARAENGCLQYLRGSNQGGYVPAKRDAPNGLFNVDDEVIARYEAVTAECDPGDAILFSDLTIHQALENVSDIVRWSIDIRFGPAVAPIISKTPRGYYCFSAADPSRVESYDTWASRYDYSKVGLSAEIDGIDDSAFDKLDDIAKAMNMPASELKVF